MKEFSKKNGKMVFDEQENEKDTHTRSTHFHGWTRPNRKMN